MLLGFGRAVIYVSVAILLAFLYDISYVTLPIIKQIVWGFWTIDGESSYFLIPSIIVLYEVFIYGFKYAFLGKSEKEALREDVFSLQKTLVSTLDYQTLNAKLRDSIKKIFRINKAEVIMFWGQNDQQFNYTKQYFESWYKDNLYIRDIIFYQERQKKSYIELLEQEIPSWAFIVFPIMEDDTCVGIFALGAKIFKEFYSHSEIKMLKSFSYFLSSHTRYIKTYRELQVFVNTLDEKVDEKTIEYNDLINKQKEFISVISHEIKSPIASAIFQSDSIIDDVTMDTLSKEALMDELKLLNDQLLRTGWLLTKLFSVQYYDTHAVNLFREKVEFPHFLEHEIELFSHIHADIAFTSNIDKKIGFVEIDKIQFQQVINNLLDNAVKFLDCNNPLIAISASKKDNILEVVIEDSGKGFQWIKIADIFDKYTTGNKWTVWLGMWLYLCKKIVTMHNGTIEAMNSEDYKWAKFVISIPIISK